MTSDETTRYTEFVAREVVTTRVVHASVERVFKAFSNPSLLSAWWGPNGFTSTFHTFEFRAGGEWRFVLHGPDGRDYENEMHFEVIEAAHRIVLDHRSEERFLATFLLESLGGGTKVTFRQLFDTRATFDAVSSVVTPSNEQLLDRLEAVVVGTSVS